LRCPIVKPVDRQIGAEVSAHTNGVRGNNPQDITVAGRKVNRRQATIAELTVIAATVVDENRSAVQVNGQVVVDRNGLVDRASGQT
jgi:hypothetical protein